jgi:hypothetical protein
MFLGEKERRETKMLKPFHHSCLRVMNLRLQAHRQRYYVITVAEKSQYTYVDTAQTIF